METLQAVSRKRIVLAIAALGLVAAGVVKFGILADPPARRNSELSSQARKGGVTYAPTVAEWASLTVEPVVERAFRAEHVTEGKIAIDEDRSTPVFSPYAGPGHQAAGAARRQRRRGPAAVRDRGRPTTSRRRTTSSPR